MSDRFRQARGVRRSGSRSRSPTPRWPASPAGHRTVPRPPGRRASPERHLAQVDDSREHPVVPRSMAAREALFDLLKLAAGQPPGEPGAVRVRQPLDAEAPQGRRVAGRESAQEVHGWTQPGHVVHRAAQHHCVERCGLQVRAHWSADHGQASTRQYIRDALGDGLGRPSSGGIADQYAARPVHGSTVAAVCPGLRGPEDLSAGGRTSSGGVRRGTKARANRTFDPERARGRGT
jgi:hypothetical protein